MQKSLLILLFFWSVAIFSQKKYSKEISLLSENDLYTSTYDDRYYTNGLFLGFKYLSKEKNQNLDKKILEWTINHKMFTPHRAVVSNIKLHDRPFAGYLFGAFGIHKIYKTNQSFKTTFELGVIGSNAFSRELQDFIHNIYGFKKAVGWEYQIKDALGLNIKFEYNQLLTKNTSNYFDIFWVNYSEVGTVFTNIESGFLTRFGFKPLQKMANSIAFNTNINNKNTGYFREIESFIFIKPSVRYSLYDATLQGSFLNTGSKVTNELIPVVFNLEIGFYFTLNRFNFGYVLNYNSNKSKDLRFENGHKYGGIRLDYLLK